MKAMDLTRFGQATYWSIIVEKKKYINTFLGLFIAYFIIIGTTNGMFTGYQQPINEYTAAAAGICIVTWIFAGGAMTAELFSNIRKKQQRTMFFMLPATNQEKFWSRVLIAMANALILSTAALVAADWVQMLFCNIFAGDAVSVTKHIWQNIGNFKFLDINVSYEGYNLGLDIMKHVAGFFAILWLISSYILGGTVFKRVPAIMTSFCWIIIWLTIGLCMMHIVSNLADKLPSLEIEFWWNPEITLYSIIAVVSLAFTTFNLWLSYRLFSKMQVITGKWLNI